MRIGITAAGVHGPGAVFQEVCAIIIKQERHVRTILGRYAVVRIGVAAVRRTGHETVLKRMGSKCHECHVAHEIHVALDPESPALRLQDDHLILAI